MSFLLNPYVYSSQVVSDPYWANVKNLIGFENGLVDEKTGVSWSSNGSWGPDANSAKFGSYGLPVNSSNQFIQYDTITTNTISDSQEFLCELWINPQQWSLGGRIFALGVVNNESKIHLRYGNNTIQLYIGGGLVGTSAAIQNLFDGTYKYIAIYKPPSSQRYYVYVEGALAITASTNFSNISYHLLTIGNDTVSLNVPCGAKIDEGRITVGGSRGAPTTIPTTAFPRS